MKSLNPFVRIDKEKFPLTRDTRCHLDPDIYKDVLKRPKSWRALFGQIDAAQGHLESKVKKNDIFLFFGWLKKIPNGSKQFDHPPRDLHVIFGYLQIGDIHKTSGGQKIPEWMTYHPHAASSRINCKTNTIYVSNKTLSWNDKIPGAGVFSFDDRLILTKEGLSRSKWQLPEIFRDVDISYHKTPWKKDYFQSTARGQEFVVQDDPNIEAWAKELIENEVGHAG